MNRLVFLLPILLIIPLSVYASSNTWIGVDCDTVTRDIRERTCNDINELDDRLDLLENDVKLLVEPDYIIMEGSNFRIDGESKSLMRTWCPADTLIISGGYKMSETTGPNWPNKFNVFEEYYDYDKNTYFLGIENTGDHTFIVYPQATCLVLN